MWCKQCEQYFPGNSHTCPGAGLRLKDQQLDTFVKAMRARLHVGEHRYGSGDARQKYLTRLEKELTAYTRTGNREHLYNVANYCLLEYYYPQHPFSHLDTTVESVTRKKGT